ncbi:siderophore ferric iron reductase [Alcaligenaceae bacterium]|nr:siderophore ferric iron reductase [Alcaligenaceae bacterium]
MNPLLENFTESMQGVMLGGPLDIVQSIDTAWAHAPATQVAWLAGSLANAYPEAGRHYWAFRTWGLLVWQPVYLTLAGIHLKGLGIRPECISQQVSPCMVGGCRIADHAPIEDDENELLDITAAALRNGVSRLFSTCRETIALHPKAADRLLADYVMGAILHIKDLRPDWSTDETMSWGRRWLDALGLRGAGGLLRYRDHAGGEHLAMDRKVCCLVYKRHDGSLCDTCPKIPLVDRLAGLARQ